MTLSSMLRTLDDRMQRIETMWSRWFGIDEIRQSPILQWMFGAVLFFFFLTFNKLIGSTATSIKAAEDGFAVCWPYFQECTQLYFLQPLPWGYSQSAFYMVLYTFILAIVFCMWRGLWARAHLLLVPLFLWKTFVMFVLSYIVAGPYDYYHLILTFILLFIPLKEYFLKLAFVLFYFLSATTKFDETWTLGTYFTTLQTGLPLFPDILTPLFTNAVIFMQVVGAWFLLSKHVLLQRTALIFFIIFHLYSGIFVFYHYPSVSILPLIILFGVFYRYQRPPLTRTSVAGWAVLGALILFQLPPWFIEGDRRMTLEGNRYGMFMFEANHQCISVQRTYTKIEDNFRPYTWNAGRCGGQPCIESIRVYEEAGLAVREERRETGAAWNRCDPYVEWSRIQAACKNTPGVERIELEFDHSVNGGPFYRIVDEPDLCSLPYTAFSHNEWIKEPPEALVVGMPVKDEYWY